MRHLYDISPDGGLLLKAASVDTSLESFMALAVFALAIVIVVYGIYASHMLDNVIHVFIGAAVAVGVFFGGTGPLSDLLFGPERAKAEAARTTAVSEFRAWSADRYGLSIGEKAASKLIDGETTFVVGSGELRTSKSDDDGSVYLVVGTSDRELIPVRIIE